ncbi:MAG: pentapeptide repeat-containing protein [Ruminococcus sp.]|nr:pentapeptide repeat-containing protein [Ruminococcus sp.]
MERKNSLADTLTACAENDTRIEGMSFEKERAEVRAENADILCCSFSGCRLENSVLSQGYFNTAEFVNCDLSGADLGQSAFRSVKFIGCRLTGTMLAECSFDTCLFEKCTGKYTVFAASKFKKCAFTECVLPEVTFTSAEFRQSFFNDSGFSKGDLTHAKMAGMDLSGCAIDGARLSLGEIRGITVNYEQAIMIAEMLGVKVI